MAPYNYIEAIPGNNRNMRYAFLVAFNEKFFQIANNELLEEIGEIISVFHNASLLIDDIEDGLLLRRGQPCAHVKFGTPLTINLGNLMYFMALQKAMKLLKYAECESQSGSLQSEICNILVDEMLNLHHGQGLDIYWRDLFATLWSEKNLPSVDDYLDMVVNKTGGLFRLSVKLLALFLKRKHTTSLVEFSNLLGQIYQIRDDYLNVMDQRYSAMKGVTGEDLIEGKMSILVLHSLHKTNESSPLSRILLELTSEERKLNPDAINAAVGYMEVLGSLEYALGLLESLVDQARELLNLEESASDSKLLEGILSHLADCRHQSTTTFWSPEPEPPLAKKQFLVTGK